MTTFSDRERSFEAKFAQDEEVQFRLLARRNKLFGAVGGRAYGSDRRRIR